MELNGKKALVTGGSGLIGSHVVDELVREGASVVVVDSMVRGHPDHLQWALDNGDVEIVTCDLRDMEMIQEAMDGCDCCFHLAATWLRRSQMYPRMSVDVTIVGTFNVLEACVRAGVEKIVASSSSSVYGEGLYLPTDEKHPYNNDLFYGAAKVCNEQHYRCFEKKYGLKFNALRYLNIYGPRQPYEAAYMDVIMHFINKIENNESPIVRGDGSATIDLVYVQDAAKANIAAMKSDVSGEFFNVCSGKETTILELANTLIRLCGKEGQVKPAFEDAMDSGLVTRRQGCPIKAKELLGFETTTSIEDGMMKVIDWRRDLSG